MKIRPLCFSVASDVAKLLSALDAHSRTLAGANGGLPEGTKVKLSSELPRSANVISCLAEQDEEILGIIFGSYTLYVFSGEGCANVQLLFVLPQFKGRGIGRNLMLVFERKARELNCSKLSLEVRVGNARAKRLYSSIGFSRGTFGPAGEYVEFWEKKFDPETSTP